MGEMQEKSDAQLLRDYAERHDEATFREIINRLKFGLATSSIITTGSGEAGGSDDPSY